MPAYAVIGADTLSAKQAVKSAGLTHNVVVAYWDQLQPGGSGAALDASAVAALNQQFADCRSVGLKPILEHAIQYPPSWAASAIEPFKDQAGNEWLSTAGTGKQVRNWMWTASGRAAVADFITKTYAALSPANRAVTDRIRFGGGYFGELQYPPESLATPYSYWGFGSSMQTGSGLAAGLSVCPLAGYVPFSGTDTQDVTWINWYLDGIENWLKYCAQALKSAGWTCDLMCLHPGFSVRTNMLRSQGGFRQNMAAGQDFARAVGAYKNDPQIWPWCTWINGSDPFAGGTNDSDQAAWKKLYAEAVIRGKHYRLWGENTGGEDNAGMDFVFANALAKTTPASGTPLTFGPNYTNGYKGYQGLMWLNYASLIAGGSAASLSHYASKIAAA